MPENDLKLISMDAVQPQPVQWLWHPYIPCGKLTLMQGDPGEGKTMLVLTIAALLSKGQPLPGQNDATEPIHIIFQTAEDGLADTVKPRLLRAEADCSRISVIDDSDTPLTILDERLEQAILREKVKLLILDPLQAFLGVDVDMHRANEVRPAFRRLTAVAERTGCAVIIVGHMNKMQGAKGIYRALGSIDIPAIARSILFVGREHTDDTERYMAQIKNSLAPLGESVLFTMENGIRFLGKSSITADRLLCDGKGEVKQSKVLNAVELLRERLSQGDAPAAELMEYFNDLSTGEKTVKTAKKEMGVRSYKVGSVWYWMLDEQGSGQTAENEENRFLPDSRQVIWLTESVSDERALTMCTHSQQTESTLRPHREEPCEKETDN